MKHFLCREAPSDVYYSTNSRELKGFMLEPRVIKTKFGRFATEEIAVIGSDEFLMALEKVVHLVANLWDV